MFRAIGFVITLVAIRVFMPEVFFAAEHALIALFTMAGDIVAHAPTSVSVDASRMTAGYIVH